MNNKKWMAILLGGIMAASLAAPCSVSAAEKTTLTFWHAMGGTNGEVLQQIVDDFNASQDEIEIKAEYQGTYDDTITKLKAAMQSDSGLPDVCQMYDVGTKFMYDSGAVIPVEDKFESTGYDKSSVMEGISSYYTVDGKQYAMPFNVSTPMLYYNKDVFEAAGLDPETKNEIFELLCRIRKERNNAIVLVSHHMEDVAQFANRVWVMHEGKIAMNGTPEEVYGRVEELEEMHIGIPQITHLTYSLIQEGLPLPRPAINVADAEEMLVRIFKGEKER